MLDSEAFKKTKRLVKDMTKYKSQRELVVCRMFQFFKNSKFSLF